MLVQNVEGHCSYSLSIVPSADSPWGGGDSECDSGHCESGAVGADGGGGAGPGCVAPAAASGLGHRAADHGPVLGFAPQLARARALDGPSTASARVTAGSGCPRRRRRGHRPSWRSLGWATWGSQAASTVVVAPMVPGFKRSASGQWCAGPRRSTCSIHMKVLSGLQVILTHTNTLILTHWKEQYS